MFELLVTLTNIIKWAWIIWGGILLGATLHLLTP